MSMKKLILLSTMILLTACGTSKTTTNTTTSSITTQKSETSQTSVSVLTSAEKAFMSTDKSVSLTASSNWRENTNDDEAKLNIFNNRISSTLRILMRDKADFDNRPLTEIAKIAFQSGFDTPQEFNLTESTLLERKTISTSTEMIYKDTPLIANLAIIDYDEKIVFIINTTPKANYNTHVTEEINKILSTLKVQ